MADNVPVTPGVGATVATDQVGSVHFQKMKLADGTDDSATMIAAGAGAAAGALRVVQATDSLVAGQGDVAHDSADSGNPLKVGAKAVNMDGTEPGTPVVEDDRTNCRSDLYGRLLVEQSHPNSWSVAANYVAAQTATEVKAAPGAGLSLYITDIVISNGATAGNVVILEDTAGAVNKTGKMYFAVNGSAALHFRTPIKLTANKNLGVTSVTCTTHSLTISGYTAP